MTAAAGMPAMRCQIMQGRALNHVTIKFTGWWRLGRDRSRGTWAIDARWDAMGNRNAAYARGLEISFRRR